MTNSISHKTIWNDAAKSGLILGLVTVVLMLPGEYMVFLKSRILVGVLSFALWLAKFIICIAVMKHYLVKFSEDHDGVRNSHTRRYGIAMAVTSALIVATYKFLSMAYINPEIYAQAMETALESYSNILTSSDIEAMRESITNYTFLFFGMFLYCVFYGTIVSSILAANIPNATSIFDEPDDVFSSETDDTADSEGEEENIDEQ